MREDLVEMKRVRVGFQEGEREGVEVERGVEERD